VENAPLAFQIKRARRKTIAIHVLADARVEVRAPWEVSEARILDFVQAKRNWIANAQHRLKARPLRAVPVYAWHTEHYFLGTAHCLLPDSHPELPLQAQIQLPLHRGADSASIAAALDGWYRQQAQALFSQRLVYWQAQLPLDHPDVLLKLRKMRRRWGSCRTGGVITLNTDLIRYPLACVDAVIVHELCHLKEMNHSPRFYAWMDTVMPSWRQADELLQHAARHY
jgi:predicted metal-dependent hydrolase